MLVFKTVFVHLSKTRTSRETEVSQEKWEVYFLNL